MTIWKFVIEPGDTVIIGMPKGAQVLSVDSQYGVPCVWALVDPDAPKVLRKFRMAGTAHHVEKKHTKNFVGTFQLDGGSLVFHLFDLGEE